MEEKIKITLPISTYEILLKDCENFEFIKSDRELNRNLFINTLIINFYEEFSLDEETFHDELLKSIDLIPEQLKDDTFEKIIKAIEKRSKSNDKSDKTITFSFKPTKLSSKAIEYINNVLIKYESISSYYRRLFNSYAHKPQNEREKIIFKENYNLLLKSINKNVQVCLSLKSGSIYNNVSVSSISSSKDELYNYVLIQDENKPRTFRLAKINNVSLLSKKREISEEILSLFSRQIKYGAQYPIYTNENEIIKVRLSKTGKELFKRIYLYRPKPILIEDNIYHFNCSYDQVVHYFKRFGCDAIIISPAILTIHMKKYYHKANRKYGNFIDEIKKKINTNT